MKFLLFLGLLWINPVAALAQMPLPAGRAPSISVAFGDEFITTGTPSARRIVLTGEDVNLTVELRPRFDIRADIGYARAFNYSSSGLRGDMLNYFVGPVIYPFNNRKYGFYLDALVGGARITGVVPTVNGYSSRGMANKIGWAVGGGWEHRMDRSLSFRAGAEYIHSVFFNPSFALQGQGSVRITVSVTYLFGGGRKR
jgi:hypothetical protein